MTFRALLVLAIVSTPDLARAAEISIGVEGSTLAADLAQALSLELGRPVSMPPGGARLVARVDRVADRLRLSVDTKEGERLLERELSLEGGAGPALRIAVVLTTQAAGDFDVRARLSAGTASVAALAPRPVRPPVAVAKIRLAGSGALSLWSSPGSIRGGFGGSVSLEGPSLFLGAELSGSGGFCCVQRTRELEADVVELHGLVFLGFRALQLGPVVVSPVAGVGPSSYRGKTKATVFAGPATEVDFTLTTLSVVAAVDLRFHLFWIFDAWFRGGARFGLGSRTVLLPEDFGPTTEPVETGVVQPLFALGLGAELWSFF